MLRAELESWLRLTLTPGVGNVAARRLLASFGLPEQIFGQSASALRQVVSATQASALTREPDTLAQAIDTTWNWLQDTHDDAAGSSSKAILTLADSAYPGSLLAIDDPPLLLYLHGMAGLLEGTSQVQLAQALAASIAIVGSRNPTPQGAANARQFARALGQAGLAIVSGLALGVDGAAHEGALGAAAPGRLATVAVVGTGLDRVYPRKHLELARRIARQGLIVSEYAIGTPPLASNFPRRNRIISALSQGTLVVEAALQSGSLITARLAAEQGKDVFAIPGSIHSTQSRGCHALIRQGAKLVESAQDILEELKWQHHADLPPGSRGADDEPSPQPDESALLQALGFDPVSLDALQARTGLPTADLHAQLMALELAGFVARLPGALFQRVAKA